MLEWELEFSFCKLQDNIGFCIFKIPSLSEAGPELSFVRFCMYHLAV
jgi:hypothetical protein